MYAPGICFELVDINAEATIPNLGSNDSGQGAGCTNSQSRVTINAVQGVKYDLVLGQNFNASPGGPGRLNIVESP